MNPADLSFNAEAHPTSHRRCVVLGMAKGDVVLDLRLRSRLPLMKGPQSSQEPTHDSGINCGRAGLPNVTEYRDLCGQNTYYTDTSTG